MVYTGTSWKEKNVKKFDIGGDENLKKKLASKKKKQLKSSGKGSRPNEAHLLDEQQIENLWQSGDIGTKAPRQLLHLAGGITYLCRE